MSNTIRKALEPLAILADAYDASEEQRRQHYRDAGLQPGPALSDGYRVTINLGDLRRARDALSALDSLGEVGELVTRLREPLPSYRSEQVEKKMAERLEAADALTILSADKAGLEAECRTLRNAGVTLLDRAEAAEARAKELERELNELGWTSKET